MARQPGFEPVLCGVCVLCVSGMLLCRHCSHRFPSHPPPKFISPLTCSNHRPTCRTCRRPKVEPVPSPPWEADLASNPESTVSRVPTPFQVCSFPWRNMSDMEEVGYTLALLWIAPKRSAHSNHTTIEGRDVVSYGTTKPHRQSHHSALPRITVKLRKDAKTRTYPTPLDGNVRREGDICGQRH